MTPRPISDEDLTVLRLIHAALRRDLARLHAAVGGSGLDRARLDSLRPMWEVFARQLHDHHVAEDELVWPVLRRRAGAAAEPILAAMTAEHATIDPALADVERTLAAAPRNPAEAEQLRNALSRVRALVEAHLSHEEADAIPLVQRRLTADDLEHVSAVQRRKAGFRGARTFLPWILDGAAPADRAHVLHELPAPLRWLARGTRPHAMRSAGLP